MVKILIRGKARDLKVGKGQFALVSRDKQKTKSRIKREGKFKVSSIVDTGRGTFLFKLNTL